MDTVAWLYLSTIPNLNCTLNSLRTNPFKINVVIAPSWNVLFYFFLWHDDNIPSFIFICIHQLYLMQHPGYKYIGFQGLIYICVFSSKSIEVDEIWKFLQWTFSCGLQNFAKISTFSCVHLKYSAVSNIYWMTLQFFMTNKPK